MRQTNWPVSIGTVEVFIGLSEPDKMRVSPGLRHSGRSSGNPRPIRRCSYGRGYTLSTQSPRCSRSDMFGDRFAHRYLPEVLLQLNWINPKIRIKRVLGNVRCTTTTLLLAVFHQFRKLLLRGQDFSGTSPEACTILWFPWGQTFGAFPKFPLIPFLICLGQFLSGEYAPS